MKSMQKLLATKGGHLPPQPQVLASIVNSHSRLGSITERLAKALPVFTAQGIVLLPDTALFYSYNSQDALSFCLPR